MFKIKLKFLKLIDNNKGSILLISYLGIVVLLGLGAAFMMLSTNEAKISERQRLTNVAFQIAEAGIERGLYDLRQDFINDSTDPSWADGDINGYTIGPDSSNYYYIPYSSSTLNNGSYRVSVKNTAGNRDAWIKATGTINDVSHTIRVYVKLVNISPWANAIFAGAGSAGGTMINGNVDVRGSVHILGNGLNDGDFAFLMGGTAELVGNNYSTVPQYLIDKVPPLPTTVINGEVVETLNSELRVKKGIVGLSGSATVGEANIDGNGVKEQVDGVYVNDGYGGNKEDANVHSDNGTFNGYDLGDTVSFPSLSDPDPDDPTKTVQEYFKENALVLTTELNNLTDTSVFSYSDGTKGSISMDGAGNLTISGRVYIDGGNNLIINKDSTKTVNYTGTGTILVTGNANINVNLLTAGNNSFPNNIIGIMTPNNIDFNEANIDVMGIFYAENSIIVQKQTDMMGTIVSNFFNVGTNVPAIYQVPETINNLPPGMIGDSSTWYLVVAWQKI